MTFGQVVAEYRKRRLLTQQRVAETLRISARELNDLERDITDPNTFPLLQELAETIKAPISELRGLALSHADHSRWRREIEEQDSFSMLTFRRSRE